MDENKVEKAVEEAVEAVKDKAEEIAEAVGEKVEKAADAIEAVEDKIEDKLDEAADAVDAAADKIDDKVEEIVEAAADKAKEVKEAVADKVDELKAKPRKAGVYHDPIKLMTEDSIKADKRAFIIGDTVKVHVRIKEGDRQRIQIFEGTVIALKHGGVSETFTVRRTSYGVGVERVFPVNSPNVEKVEVVRHGKTRRAKLYYLRDRVGKSAKLKQKLDR